MSAIRYVVHPGWVESQTDGDRHFIGFQQLVRLYRVYPRECINAQDPRQLRGWSEERFTEFKHLFPRFSGNYPMFRKD